MDRLHVLQPNQYAAGSMPFTASERKIAVLPDDNLTRIAAEIGYPLMITAGAELAEMGLPFLNITDIFAAVTEPIYRDGCCHYHDLGYELLAHRIADEFQVASH